MADLGSVGLADTGGVKARHRAVLVEGAERGVLRVPDHPRQLRDLMQQRLGLQLGAEREARLVERLEPSGLRTLDVVERGQLLEDHDGKGKDPGRADTEQDEVGQSGRQCRLQDPVIQRDEAAEEHDRKSERGDHEARRIDGPTVRDPRFHVVDYRPRSPTEGPTHTSPPRSRDRTAVTSGAWRPAASS